MKTESLNYVQFPLFLLNKVHLERKSGLNEILSFGIYYYSKRFKVELYDVARQIVYENYRGKLSKLIRQELSAIESTYLGGDADYYGFSGSEFEPTDEIEELLGIMEQNEKLKLLCIEFYQVHLARESLPVENIPAKGMTERTILAAKQIEKATPKNEPLPMVNVKQIFDFRDNDRSEFDVMQFAANIAIRSILGTKRFCKTNKLHILCRMLGYSSVKFMPEQPDAQIEILFNKYSHRYHMDKLLDKLQLNWGVLVYSNNMRGMYVGLSSSITMNELAVEAEKRKSSFQKEQLKQKRNDAKAHALQHLKDVG